MKLWACEKRPFWWENGDTYWELPFFAEFGLTMAEYPARYDELAIREQLWAQRECWDDIPETTGETK